MAVLPVLRWRAVPLAVVMLLLPAIAPAAAATPGPSATRSPVRTVSVQWGKIGYRSVGVGRPLVLLVGGGGPADSIDIWTPVFIDALARHRRVLAIDYEGIGRTTLRPGTITIPRLANDAADFIRGLHLRRPDILGWSMGGMVAQALLINHPRLARRVILAATAPGDGRAVPQEVDSPPPYPFAYLFPPGPKNAGQAAAFNRSVHRYPHFYQGSSRVAQLQFVGFKRWLNGDEPTGRRLSTILAPVLVADGAQDQLLPVKNSRMLASTIPGARLQIDPHAAHGFLFQHITEWVEQIDRFLS